MTNGKGKGKGKGKGVSFTDPNIKDGPKTPFWKCACGCPGNFASRIRCMQCGQPPSPVILNKALAQDKIAKYGLVRPASQPKAQGQWQFGAPRNLQPQWKEMQQLQQKLAKLEDKIAKGASQGKDQNAQDPVSVLEALKGSLKEGEDDKGLRGKVNDIQEILKQQQDEKAAADLKAKPWSKKWQISTAAVAKYEKQLDQGKDRESRAQERVQKAKEELLASQANIAQIQCDLDKATAAHHSLLACKDAGDMECEEDSAALSLEQVSKLIPAELLQKPEVSQAFSMLQQLIKDNQKEPSRAPAFNFSEEPVNEEEDADKLCAMLLKPGRFAKVQAMWTKLQTKHTEEKDAGNGPADSDDAAGGDNDGNRGFMGAVAKSLTARTSKSERYQPYSG